MQQKSTPSFDRTEISYLINRASPKQPFLVFIHGAGSNHTLYKPFFAAFEFNNFIALDLRNHGNSGRSAPEKITIENLAKDIEAVLKAEKINEVIPLANSLGTTIALEFYKNNRKQVKQMVLFTAFSKRYIRFSSLSHIVVSVLSPIAAPFSGWRKLSFQDYHKYKERPIWFYPYLDIRGTPVGTVIKLIKELFRYQISFSSIIVPTLLFISEDDWSTKNSLIRSDCKDNKHITIITLKANHVPLTREHLEIVKIVKRFVNLEQQAQ